MSDNKFIKRLKGEQTAKSVLEIKNESAKTSFANMPQGTSNAIDVFSDHRGNATAVLNGTTNWKISNSDLLLADIVSGDGQDFTSTYSVSGAGLWVNASYTFPSTGDPRHPVAMVFNPSTKWVLKVCGDNLIVDGGSTVDFTMLVKIGTASVYSKNFTIRESAGQFSKEFIIDFGEANSDVVKAGGLSTLTVQLLCGTANASARIYNGMTVLTCLQRKVDASAVSNSSANVEDVLDGNIIPSDYFSNPEFIDQIEDGDTAVAIFARDGDDVNLDHWEQPIPDRTGNAGKFLQTPDGNEMSWEDVEISDVTGLQTELNGLQGQITVNKNTMDLHIGDTNNPHQVTKAQVGLGNVDNTSDLAKPISTATQTALNAKANIADLATVATSGSYNDLSNKPTIPTVNNPTITITQGGVTKGSFTLNQATGDTIALDAGGSNVDIDNTTITTNTDQEIQTVAVINANTSVGATNPIYDWIGTLAEYNAQNIRTAHPNWLCFITDDEGSAPTIGNGTITITQGGTTKGTFSVNQTGNSTINLDAGGSGLVDDVQVNNVSVVTNKVAKITLATVATSGSYNDLSNKPTIPTVGNGTITITQGGTTMGSFTTNQSGDQTIALDSGGYHPDLFDVKWADHICNDVQWLRADTFSWQSGAVYQVAYQHLADDITGKTLQSETISGTTIQFYLADDGHKICPASQESNVMAIYNATGVAWYYIIDTANQRFKLPRTKFGFTGIRSGVGGYVEPAIPNIKGGLYRRDTPSINPNAGPAYQYISGAVDGYFGNSGAWAYNTIQLNASLCSSVYKDDATTVQPPATEMYLYFYVGNFTQTALENTAGVTTETLNEKADIDLSNVSTTTRSGFLFSVSQESMSAGNYYTLTFPNEIDPAKVKVNAYAVIKTANNNFAVGDVIPFESLWGQNYRPLSIRIKSTNLQFNTSDQISTNNPNNSGSGVNIVSYIRIVFDVYQVK